MKVSVTIHKEGEWYVAIDPITGVASQGKTIDKALKNFKEAFELWFENAEKWERKQLKT
jgi:predicted RNase H-like HicB family nuclease